MAVARLGGAVRVLEISVKAFFPPPLQTSQSTCPAFGRFSPNLQEEAPCSLMLALVYPQLVTPTTALRTATLP